MPTPADPAAAITRARAECPRCGYDLSGVVESWKESCPLEGVCSECGLEVVWGRVLKTAASPQWSCEHVERMSAWRVLKTGLRTLRPWKFWGRLTMEDRVAPRRLGLMLFKGTMAVYAIGAVATLATFVVTWLLFSTVRPLATPGLPEYVQTVTSASSWPWTTGWQFAQSGRALLSWSLLCVVIVGTLLPWSLGLLRTTLASARVRSEHLTRGSAYALLGHFVLLLSVALIGLAAEIGLSGAFVRGWPWNYDMHGLILHPFMRLGAHLLFTAAMWSAFVVVYLRLKHAWATVMLLGLLGMLVMLVVWFVPTALGIIQVWSFR